jgi:hypothetical protein
MEIRLYMAADEGEVAALWNEVLPDSAPHNEPRGSIRRKLAFDRDLFFVAVEGGGVVGTAMGGYDGHRGWLYSVAVSPQCRGRGIGSALVRQVEAALKRRGCLKINLQVVTANAGVVDFYEKLGFKVEERISMGKRLYEQA